MKETLKLFIVTTVIAILLYLFVFGISQFFLTLFLPLIKPTVQRVTENYGFGLVNNLSLSFTVLLISLFSIYYPSWLFTKKYLIPISKKLVNEEKALKEVKELHLEKKIEKYFKRV